jgi:ankyrin repeat protein
MSSSSGRFLISVVALGNLLFGAAWFAWGVYVLWAGAEAVSFLVTVKEHATGLAGNAQVTQAADLATKGIGAWILAMTSILGGCAIAQGLPLVLVGVGLLLRRGWARVLALVFAVLFGLEGLGLLLGPPSRPALILGGALVAQCVLSFVALQGLRASHFFAGQEDSSPANLSAGETMTTSQPSASAPPGAGRPAVAVLSAALVLSILGMMVLALRPVSFTVVPPAGAVPGPDGNIKWELTPVQWLTAGVWPDTSAAYRDRVARLHDAASKGQVSRIIEMLQMGASANDKDEKGQTALMLASGKGHNTIVVLLLMAGAQVNEKDDKGETALMRAAENGHDSVVKQLVGADPDEKVIQALLGQLATLKPTVKGKEGAIKLPGLDLKMPKGPLVQRHMVEVNARDNQGRTAFLRAVKNDWLAIASYLVTFHSADPSIADKQGNSALHLLAANSRSEAWNSRSIERDSSGNLSVRVFWSFRVGSISTANAEGMEPWMIAAAAGHLNVVQKMLAKAASVRDRLAHRNNKGKTGLELAREAGHKEVVAYLETLAATPRK